MDYNDHVKEGDLVAQIDPTVYEAHLAQDRANLTQSVAAVEEAQAKLAQADKDLERARALAKREMVSEADLDAAVATRDTLAAQLKVAQAAVEQSKAALRLSQANLDYTTIRSPVAGVVIARNVSEGQTVVASMSAQVLFVVATDLREVQVEASIPEADIGKIRLGQSVSFNVDAHEETFTGTVAQIRLAAATVQNVVTYPVVIHATNPDIKLFPSMTANIVCEVARKTGVLKAPNAALRFKPPSTETSPTRAAEGGAGSAFGKGAGGRGEASRSAVWIPSPTNGPPVRVAVRLGITDGTSTELREAPGLDEGQVVMVGLAEKSAAASTTTVNPFVTQMPRGGARPPR